jgi:hypothetical protein
MCAAACVQTQTTFKYIICDSRSHFFRSSHSIRTCFFFFVLFSAMGWGGYGKGGYGWGFPPMMMMPWGKGKGKARLHVFPNDSLVSLLQVACIKT